MKSFKCAQRLSISMLIVFAVLSAFSCKGMLLPPPTSKTGTLTIALPGNGARRGYTQDDADFFKISIIFESTKEVVIPAQEADTETFTAELNAGSYSVIVQGMNNANLAMPLFYGRTNNVTVTAGETTTATIVMREFHTETSTYSGNMEMLNPDWGSGKLPSLAFDYFDFEGWYTDAECTQAITEYPATDSEDFTYPFAKLVRKPVFYATMTGSGKGLNADNPMGLENAFTELARFSRETNKVPTLVLLEDVQLDGSAVGWSVNIIGAKNGVDNEPVTVTGAVNGCVVPFNAGTSCTVKNLIIVNGNAATGIKNAGNLTFENCVFNPDSQDLAIENTGSLTLTNCQISSTSGAQGIKNAGSLKMTDCSISGCGTNTTLGGGIYTTQPITLINTSITGCNGSYGKMIYCAKEEGGNPTVNGISAEFEGDFYFDGSISQNTQYDASTFPASATAAGVFYASTSGSGDGKSASSPMEIATALTAAKGFTRCVPTIYLIGDITMPSTQIDFSVNLIGMEKEDGSKITITGGTTVDGSTGAILDISDGETHTVKNVQLTNKRGIRISKGSLTVNNCVFDKCRVTTDTTDGGGIYSSSTGNITIDATTFTSCSTTFYGGAVRLIAQAASLTVTNTTIDSCKGGFAGGICVNSNTIVTIKDTTIKGCSANNYDASMGTGASGRGGGLYINQGSIVTITNTTITGCTAKDGKSNSVFTQGTESQPIIINGVEYTNNPYIKADIPEGTDWSTLTWLTN